MVAPRDQNVGSVTVQAQHLEGARGPDRKKVLAVADFRRGSIASFWPSALVRAQLGAIKHLPESYRREQIDAGMQALAGQVMLWAETSERSSQRTRHALADLAAYARMFRNDLHNISLREEIDRRAWERREQHIQPLRNRG
jgi:hypothetical protein